MARPATLRRAANGLYFRNLGKTASGTVPKFYLGRDRLGAAKRNEWLEALWATVKPVWTETALAEARRIASADVVERLTGQVEAHKQDADQLTDMLADAAEDIRKVTRRRAKMTTHEAAALFME